MTKVPTITFVIVGFRIDQTKSCFYAKAKSLEECIEKVEDCFITTEAQFISIRAILPETKETENETRESP